MRVYLAAKYSRMEELRGYRDELTALGHPSTPCITATVNDAFAKAGLALSPGYEGFFYHNDPGCSDFCWYRFDPNDKRQKEYTGIFLFDQYDWTPIEDCVGFTLDDVDVLNAQIPEAIPMNGMPLYPYVLDKLPGIVQDIWIGRFASIDHAKAEDND